MKIRNFIYYFMILFSGNCSRGQDQGIVINHSYFFGPDDSTTIPPLDISRKIFFKNKKSIQEVPLIIFKGDSSGQKTDVKIKHYSFLDPDENVCYNYSSFSDTAKPMRHYSDIDSVSAYGGWNFYSNKKFDYDSSKNLTDTVINNTIYGRIRLDKKINYNNIYFILYFRRDKREEMIKVFKPLSDSIGFAIVRDDTFIKDKLFMSEELEFISDKLSQEELKIFDAWEKNLKKYPVSK